MELPNDIFRVILLKLHYRCFSQTALVCKQLNNILHDEQLWQMICNKYSISSKSINSQLAIAIKKIPTHWSLNEEQVIDFVSPLTKWIRRTSEPLSKNKPNVTFKSKHNHVIKAVWLGVYCFKSQNDVWRLAFYDRLLPHNVKKNNNFILVSEVSDNLIENRYTFTYDDIKKKINLYKNNILICHHQAFDEVWYPVLAVEDGEYYNLVQLKC